jgi:hypothetical protein
LPACRDVTILLVNAGTRTVANGKRLRKKMSRWLGLIVGRRATDRHSLRLAAEAAASLHLQRCSNAA